MPAGRGSVITTLAASLGPLFVTPSAYTNVSPTDRGLVTWAPPTLKKATLLIVRLATGLMTWLKPALLFERSGSPVFELTAAASAIVWPAVPGASVPLIVIVAVVFAAIVPSVHTSGPAGDRQRRARRAGRGGRGELARRGSR